MPQICRLRNECLACENACVKQLIQKIGIAVYIVLLVSVTAKLFFEQELTSFLSYLKPKSVATAQTLTIGVSYPIVSIDPRANDVGSRMYALQVFEPLVRRTPSLDIESSLALSYGMLSPTEWEFRLRPNIHLHDDSILTADDVKKSIEHSRGETSGVSEMLSTVESVSVAGDSIRIHTALPDMLLPQKMASVLVFKRTDVGYIGTGAFRPVATSLEKFSNYWGPQPSFDRLTLVPLLTKKEKVSALSQNSVDILMNIPADVAADFSQKKYSLAVQPGIEADMLLMNMKGPLSDLAVRKAIQATINPNELTRFGHGYATVNNQLVPSAVFGFNPSISLVVNDLHIGKDLLLGAKEKISEPLVLDLPRGLETFGKTIATQLAQLGLLISVQNLTADELSTKIVQASSPFYFFGWQHELGDSLPFLASVLHSRDGAFGEFNGMNYHNKQVDSIIEEALKTSDPMLRREFQRQVMKIAVVDDAIAVPLFSPDTLYAVKNSVSFAPRVDGYVLASEIVVK